MALFHVIFPAQQIVDVVSRDHSSPPPPVFFFFLPLLRQRDAAAINLISSSLNYFQQTKHLTTVMDHLVKRE